MKSGLILTVGNNMMGDDGAGALLAHMLRANPLQDWEVLHGDSAPENAAPGARTRPQRASW
jgi:hydrogenase 3 maturation protease